ncbi:Uncharacterised protein [Mycobacteroides abscessus subsp. abscessus]|nr:Uncharacterised protein [Mycobacteroides abscessus subsp. abscessus]
MACLKSWASKDHKCKCKQMDTIKRKIKKIKHLIKQRKHKLRNVAQIPRSLHAHATPQLLIINKHILLNLNYMQTNSLMKKS